MILNFQYTADDYREAHAAVKAQGLMSVKATPFFYLGLGFCLGSMLGNIFQRQPAREPPRSPIDIVLSSLPYIVIMGYWAVIVFRSGGRKAHGFVAPPPKLAGAGVLVPALAGLAAFVVTFLVGALTPPSAPTPANQPQLPLKTALAVLFLPYLPMATLLLLTALLLVRLHKLNVNRAFDLQVNLHRPVVFELSDVFLTVATATRHTRYAWNAFIGWHETPNVFLLYVSYISFEMVPKRALVTPQQLEYFRTFIARTVGEHHRGFEPAPANLTPPSVETPPPVPLR